MKKISQKTGLIIIIPVILGMLGTGIYMWPENMDMESYREKKKAIQDSIEQAKRPQEFQELGE